MTGQERKVLSQIIDQRTREVNQRDRVLAPRTYTRCKNDQERQERRRASWRAYYQRNREDRCEAQKVRYAQRRAAV